MRNYISIIQPIILTFITQQCVVSISTHGVLGTELIIIPFTAIIITNNST